MIRLGAQRAGDIHHAVATGDLVAVNSTMNGRHVSPWALYDADGAVDSVFPPTNRTFSMTQSHWFRIEDGRILEHWANRDDLGMATQLGWLPPTPVFFARMVAARRRARRSAGSGSPVSGPAAAGVRGVRGRG